MNVLGELALWVSLPVSFFGMVLGYVGGYKRRGDLTLIMQRYFKSGWPTVFSGAPVRVGLPPSKTRDGVAWFNTRNG